MKVPVDRPMSCPVICSTLALPCTQFEGGYADWRNWPMAAENNDYSLKNPAFRAFLDLDTGKGRLIRW
jgi:hypothetical protein